MATGTASSNSCMDHCRRGRRQAEARWCCAGIYTVDQTGGRTGLMAVSARHRGRHVRRGKSRSSGWHADYVVDTDASVGNTTGGGTMAILARRGGLDAAVRELGTAEFGSTRVAGGRHQLRRNAVGMADFTRGVVVHRNVARCQCSGGHYRWKALESIGLDVDTVAVSATRNNTAVAERAIGKTTECAGGVGRHVAVFATQASHGHMVTTGRGDGMCRCGGRVLRCVAHAVALPTVGGV